MTPDSSAPGPLLRPPLAPRLLNAYLLGAFGSGKSSILNFVQGDLEGKSPRLIVATIDVWTVPSAEDAPSQVLTSIINALDDYVDTIDLRGLPRSYRRLVSALPSGRFARFLGVEWSTDSVQAIERLSPLLEALGARLVLIVEDIERTGEKFDHRHLARFLLKFKALDRTAVILAMDIEKTSFDFAKLCDTIERVPLINSEDVRQLLKAAYDYWRENYTDIDPHPDRANGDKIGIHGYARGIDRSLADLGIDTPMSALVRLLQTPRALKNVLSQVGRVWHQLHGEAELDDILIISALRYGARDVFEFLLTNIDAARTNMDRLQHLPQTIEQDWKKLTSATPVGSAANTLVGRWGIEQLSPSSPPDSPSPQGVENNSGPTDYFSRILAEGLAQDELPDQEVLRHIRDWNDLHEPAEPTLVDRLIAARHDNFNFVAIWSQFAHMHTDDKLKRLTEHVMEKLRPNEDPFFRDVRPLLDELRKKCRATVTLGDYEKFAMRLVTMAVQSNLSLANYVMGYWPEDKPTLIEIDRATFGKFYEATIKAQLNSVDDLVCVLDRRDPHSIRSVVLANHSPIGIQKWGLHFAELVLDGVKKHPETMLPQLASLSDSGGRSYTMDRSRMKRFFSDKTERALDLLAEYQGQEEYLLNAKQQAVSWLGGRMQ